MPRPSAAILAAVLLGISIPGAGRAAGLPEGEARALIEGVCSGCHASGLIQRSAGYTAAGWRELVGSMVDLSASPEDGRRIVDYLAARFPPNDRRAPTLIAGQTRLAFKEWRVPTPGQRARDPVQAPDGSIWWAGQWTNLIGRIDPATGAMKEYPLPANAMPHTVTADAAGNVWYTGNRNGTLGRLDPKTGQVTVYEMPDPTARDPHSAVFDRAGKLWFTLQQSNMVGRLDPTSGEIRLKTMPTPGARPYGIKIDAEGAPWVACNGSNCLVRVDPATMELREVRLPDPATRVRRLAIAEDGAIWFVNSSLGRLGRLRPETGKIREWPSPSGPDSHPYAIVVVGGSVWYNESGKRPDTLVRFDPGSERFQSWPIPSGGIHAGIVRHMRATREGNLLLHQSASNRIILVTPARPSQSQ